MGIAYGPGLLAPAHSRTVRQRTSAPPGNWNGRGECYGARAGVGIRFGAWQLVGARRSGRRVLSHVLPFGARSGQFKPAQSNAYSSPDRKCR